MDLMQYLQDYGAGDGPEEESWLPSNDQFRQAAVPILSMADAMTGTLGSRLGAGVAALAGGGGEGDFSNRYTSIMDRLAADKSRWQAEHPAMNVLSQVANVPGYVTSVAATPGLSGLGVVPQALAGLGINRGLDELLGATLDDRAASQPRPSQEQLMASRIKQNTEPAGPNQNSPAGEVANFRIGNGEWQNGLDSRIGKNFSKGAPGSASAASERYQGVLEPGREDQVRQLYANTYEKIINGYSKSIASITDPKSREAAMKQIGNLAHETAMRVIPPEYQAQFGMGEETPQGEKAGADSEDPSTDGEGWGMVAAIGGTVLAGLGYKMGLRPQAIIKMIKGQGAASAKETLTGMAKKAGRFVRNGGPEAPPVLRAADLSKYANKGVNTVMPDIPKNPMFTGIKGENAKRLKELAKENAPAARANAFRKLAVPAKETMEEAKTFTRHKYVPGTPK